MTGLRPRLGAVARIAATALAFVAVAAGATTSQGFAPGGAPEWARGRPYDLGRDEARGGHTLARHVGRSDAELRARLAREPRIAAASTFTDRPTAELVVGTALARARRRVARWLESGESRANLVIDYRGSRGGPIGRSLRRGDDRPRPAWDAVVVLRRLADGGFVVLTSYPEVRR